MIQDFKISELEEIMKIWLDTNIRTHDFIPEQYWLNNFALVKNLLPQADILVYQDNSTLKKKNILWCGENEMIVKKAGGLMSKM
jgi:putative acetyltransferase